MVHAVVLDALEQANDLKSTIRSSRDLTFDPDVNCAQKQLQKICQQVLILDLEYALNQKLEHDLWNYGFKNFIDVALKLAKDKKHPKHSEYQSLLYSYLEASSGFYLGLLQEICTTFAVNLPMFSLISDEIFSLNKFKNRFETVIQTPERQSLFYICLDCFVHLGDIARYRCRYKQAESFYRSAILISPVTGQPYNQLALLEMAKGNKLGMVFYYIRSIAVKNPFPAAASNLSIILEKSNNSFKYEDTRKLSSTEIVPLFLKIHACLHFAVCSAEFNRLMSLFASSLTALIATGSCSSWALVQIVVINIHAYNYLFSKEGDNVIGVKGCMEEVKSLTIELIALTLNAFLIPIYTFKEGENILQYSALPAVYLTLCWIQLNAHLLKETGLAKNLQLWAALCKLFNILDPLKSLENQDKCSLPEEQDLQGFVPFSTIIPEFRCGYSILNLEVYDKLRAARICQFGTWLTNSKYSLIQKKKDGDVVLYEPMMDSSQVSNELISELEELCLNNVKLKNSVNPALTNGYSSIENMKNGLPVKNNSGLFTSSAERRVGILKSIATDEEQNNADILPKKSKSRKNVALQTILRRNQEAKQVTFKTPSPSLSVSSDNQDSFNTSLTPPWNDDSLKVFSKSSSNTNKNIKNKKNNQTNKITNNSQSNVIPNQNGVLNLKNSFPVPPFRPSFSNCLPAEISDHLITSDNLSNSKLTSFYLPPVQPQCDFIPSWNQHGREKHWVNEEYQNFNLNSSLRAEEQSNSLLEGLPAWQYVNGQTQMNNSMWPNQNTQLFNQSEQISMEDQRNMYPLHQIQLPLFNNPIWSNNTIPDSPKIQQPSQSANNLLCDALPPPIWSADPSPLQRLVEKQKQLRDSQSFQSIHGEE